MPVSNEAASDDVANYETGDAQRKCLMGRRIRNRFIEFAVDVVPSKALQRTRAPAAHFERTSLADPLKAKPLGGQTRSRELHTPGTEMMSSTRGSANG